MFNRLRFRAGGTPAAMMSPQDAIRGAQEGSVTVIDIREHAEVAQTGKAKGALHIPLMQLLNAADPNNPDSHPELSPDRTIAVYCASGARANGALTMLRQHGYTDVHNIGGLAHWHQAGGELERA